ncbi:MAG: HK97 family phage prohead protease [Rhodobacteraceae bacterium]|jgi:hypothetical protein|nr:HK97 family phage prohead protease [Paracoccaceae bacterium]
MADRTSDIIRAAALPVEVRLSAGQGMIEGLASPFGPPGDMHGTTFARGAYAASLKDFRAAGRWPAMLWDHRSDAVVGRWLDMQERDDGLHVTGRLNLGTTSGREAYEHLRAGDISGLSVGFIPQETRGDTFTRVRLLEVSLVAIPSADRARVAEVRHLQSRAELRDVLIDAGLARGAADKIARGGWAGLTGETIDIDDADELAREMRAIAATFKGEN